MHARVRSAFCAIGLAPWAGRVGWEMLLASPWLSRMRSGVLRVGELSAEGRDLGVALQYSALVAFGSSQVQRRS
jgi:hypothetical protein